MKNNNSLHLINLFVCLTLIFCVSKGLAQSTTYNIDLTHAVKREIAPFAFSGTAPDGTALSVNSQYFERNGKPWYPLMGEFHYSRYPEKYWEEEILKMKSAGISIIATYVFWNVHENPRNTWNWSGMLDLRHFIELCKKHDIYVWIRIGPYDNAELINGGLPSWIVSLKSKRSNDSTYISESMKLYQQIGKQTRGLFFKDGGPIIGTQLENEYASGDIEHIGVLKKMALSSGITPVYFSVTANTLFRDDKFEVIPLQGAYPYRGWEKAGGSSSRDFLYGNDQWILTGAIGKLYYDVNKYPKGLCEQGSGSQVTYDNRFQVDPGVIEAHLQNQIGRGMNMVGYYMFQGGTQIPEFKRPDCPVSYDFQAPLSEFGFITPSYRYLKILHNFIHDFGNELALMQAIQPDNPVRDENDTTNLRYIVRVSGNSGYLFLCNTQVRVQMPKKTFRVRIKLPDETIEFPRSQLNLNGGTTAIIPFNMIVNGALLKYATAQPLARFTSGDKQTLFLTEVGGMEPELVFDAKTITEIKADGWKIERTDGKIFLSGGHGAQIDIKSSTGQRTVIVLLTREQAENSWRATLGKQEVLIISKADLMFDKTNIEFRQLDNPDFSFSIYPSGITFPKVNNLKTMASSLTTFEKYSVREPSVSLNLNLRKISSDKTILTKPVSLPASLSDIQLKIDYLGGSAEAWSNGKILTDDLLNGNAWLFGLKRYINDPAVKSIEFRTLPWQDSITGVPDSLVRQIKGSPAGITHITAIPEYKFILKL